MAHKTTAESLHLATMDDLRRVVASWFWWERQPTFLSMAATEGRLLRSEVEALRNYCDAVLARMPNYDPIGHERQEDD
jgi:hypothetical protein